MVGIRAAVIAALALCACGGETNSPDAGAMDAGQNDAGRSDAGADAGGADGGVGVDAGEGLDAGIGVDAGSTDAGDLDAGPVCGAPSLGRCDAPGLECLGCPAGGPLMNYLCTTACMSDGECTDAARPICNRPAMGLGGGAGICTDSTFVCAWGAVCASPDTPIATPFGESAIADLDVGDLVYTMHEGALVARPILHITQRAVLDHAVVRVVLATGGVLEISGRHPTADGRLFTDLVVGGLLDGVAIEAVEMIPYMHAFTHDILPDSDTGTYVAGGALIGTTIPR